MNPIDLLAQTPIVVAGTAFGTTALLDRYGSEAVSRASLAGLYHFHNPCTGLYWSSQDDLPSNPSDPESQADRDRRRRDEPGGRCR